MLKCPRCSTGLETVLYEGVEIETCPGCGGEWLDAGELRQIVQHIEAKFSREELGQLDALHKNVFQITSAPDQNLSCPKCPEQKLSAYNYASSSGIILDKCPGCGGVWLDRNELEAVQVLVEEWNRHLDSDVTRYGSVAELARQRAQREAEAGLRVPRFGFVMAILRTFL
ncbi:MAG: hypothetical protein FJ387_30340 [Verrucomicrobia bacterium]|nr:hypothetical protein [Verrucomicrobiota bacterium]